MNGRDLRVEQAMPYTKEFVARWARKHGLFATTALYDDVESDCMAAMLALAGEWDEQRGVPWMPFLGTFLGRRLVGEIRRHTGRPSHPSFARRHAIDRPLHLRDEGEDASQDDEDDATWWLARPERGYSDVDNDDQLDRLLAGHPARTRSIARDYAAGYTCAELGVMHSIDPTQVRSVLRGVRSHKVTAAKAAA